MRCLTGKGDEGENDILTYRFQTQEKRGGGHEGGWGGGLRVVTLVGFVSVSVSHDFIESPAFIVFVYCAAAPRVNQCCFIIGSLSAFPRPSEKKKKTALLAEIPREREKKTTNVMYREKRKFFKMSKDIDVSSEVHVFTPSFLPPAFWASCFLPVQEAANCNRSWRGRTGANGRLGS